MSPFLWGCFSKSRAHMILTRANEERHSFWAAQWEGAHTNVCRKLFWGRRLSASRSGSNGSQKLIKLMKFPSVRWTHSPVYFSVQKHSVGWLNTDFASKDEQELSPQHWKDNSVTLCTLFFLLLHTFHGLQERKLSIAKAEKHFRQHD